MAYRLLPTFRLARQLSRELSSPFWAKPRPSFWWDFPRLPSESEIIKEHLGMVEKLLRPVDIPPSISNTTYYRYYAVPKTEEKVAQSEHETSEGSKQHQAESNKMDHTSEVSDDKPTAPQDFQISFDLNEFSPEEIKVKLVGDSVLYVEAKHESKKDGREVQKYFSHYYNLPDNVDTSALKSSIGQDGTLTMTAPLTSKQSPPQTERIIPIEQHAAEEGPAKDTETSNAGNPEGPSNQ